RVVDVAIDDVRDDVVRMLAATYGVRREPEVEHPRFGEKPLSFSAAEALALRRPREQRIERRLAHAAFRRERARARAPIFVEEAPGRLRQKPAARRLVEEALEPAPLFVAEVVAHRLSQIRADRARRAVAPRSILVGDRIPPREARGLRVDEHAL